ncbi:MAG: hypothetical protein HQM03_09775 [Magnetococcales bacterium]|nr:hypothetical protein [Magnetococcales bacterium]
METIRREYSVMPTGTWTGVRGEWPLITAEEEPTSRDLTPPVGLSGDFLLELFRFHMAWLRQVSGLNEPEAKRRVLSLLKAGRLGYEDECGKRRTLPVAAIHWVLRHA